MDMDGVKKAVDIYTVLPDGKMNNTFHFRSGVAKDYGNRPLDWEQFMKYEAIFDSHILKIRGPRFSHMLLTRLEEEE